MAVAALAADIMAAALADPDPVALEVPDPADSDIITPIIPLWADGIGMDPAGITVAAVAAWAG